MKKHRLKNAQHLKDLLQDEWKNIEHSAYDAFRVSAETQLNASERNIAGKGGIGDIRDTRLDAFGKCPRKLN